jgi:hypothetical protein
MEQKAGVRSVMAGAGEWGICYHLRRHPNLEVPMPRTRNLPTRAEWEATTASPELLRPFLFHFERQEVGRLVQRKLRLNACAAARCLWKRIPEDVYRRAVEVGERFADGAATEKERERTFRAALEAHNRLELAYGIDDGTELYLLPDRERAEVSRALSAAAMAITCVKPPMSFATIAGICHTVPGLLLPVAKYMKGYSVEHGYQFGYDQVKDPLPPLVRDILGYPFAPVKFEKKWRTETVRLLTDGITAEGKFDRLPILADALEEAGCDDADVLNHCRGPGPHVRGCWVVDLIRGVHWQPKL